LPVFIYNIFLFFYRAAIGTASLWNLKAKKWIKGRKEVFQKIKLSIGEESNEIIWFHCSSLGEFEQGRPVMEKLRAEFPASKLLVTFFSPSGYEVRQNYSGADYIFYLPHDSKENARRFLDLVKPTLAVFIKYDYWYHYLSEIKRRNINCLLVSAIFRKEQAFFKFYGGLQRDMLRCFTEIFVQTKESKELLESIGIQNCIVSGDTRFDSVIDIAERFEAIPLIETFINNKKSIVAGSTWDSDEEALRKVLDKLDNSGVKLIVAPHEVHEEHLNALKKLFPESTRFSELAKNVQRPTDNILIIDNIGMLSRLYSYASISYVGGGFTPDGVHNVLEAAVYGKPVVFGKNFKKYKEAADLINFDGGKSFSSDDELYQILVNLLNDEEDYRLRSEASRNYVWSNRGATEQIVHYIVENRLLTS